MVGSDSPGAETSGGPVKENGSPCIEPRIFDDGSGRLPAVAGLDRSSDTTQWQVGSDSRQPAAIVGTDGCVGRTVGGLREAIRQTACVGSGATSLTETTCRANRLQSIAEHKSQPTGVCVNISSRKSTVVFRSVLTVGWHWYCPGTVGWHWYCYPHFVQPVVLRTLVAINTNDSGTPRDTR